MEQGGIPQAIGNEGPPTERLAAATTEVAGAVHESAHDLKGTLGEEARGVAVEATERARGLVAQANDQARQQLSEQVDHLGAAFTRMRDELDALADGRPEEAGSASEYTRNLASELGRIGEAIASRGIEGLMGDLEGLARRRPGAFLGGAALAGFLTARMLRARRDASEARPSAPPAPGVELGGQANLDDTITGTPPTDASGNLEPPWRVSA